MMLSVPMVVMHEELLQNSCDMAQLSRSSKHRDFKQGVFFMISPFFLVPWQTMNTGGTR